MTNSFEGAPNMGDNHEIAESELEFVDPTKDDEGFVSLEKLMQEMREKGNGEIMDEAA